MEGNKSTVLSESEVIIIISSTIKQATFYGENVADRVYTNVCHIQAPREV
jgi:hypothetical protein